MGRGGHFLDTPLFDMKYKSTRLKGFTFIELLLVIATLAILLSIVLVIFRSNRLAEARNARRWSDVRTIVDAVYEYSIDHSGFLPGEIPIQQTEICKTGVADCSGYVNLSILTNEQIYLVQIPEDLTGASERGTGYEIKVTGKRISVYAPFAEEGEIIEVTK